MPHDLPTVVGRDMAGVVVAVGADRTDVVAGEEVFGADADAAIAAFNAGTRGKLVLTID